MQFNYIKTILGLKDKHLRITKAEINGSLMNIHLEYSQGHQVCTNCQCITSKIHDYRVRQIKHGFTIQFLKALFSVYHTIFERATILNR